MKISNDVMNILVKSTLDGNKLFLPNIQLDRKLYVDVNKVLENIGGKWTRGVKAHVFNNDPSDVLDEIINTGEYTDKKKEFQFFETPDELAERMVNLAEIKGDIVLEPSAGRGRILSKIDPDEITYAIELEKSNYEYLVDRYNDSVFIINADFMNLTEWQKNDVPLKFDKIVMNPPFSNGQDVKHILHAWNLLANGGTLVSIVSESPFFRENKLSQEFRTWIDENAAYVESLDSGIFKESGTMVKTRLIVAKRL